MIQEFNSIINKLTPFCETHQVQLMYMFGSRVVGDESTLSDYDFAILLSNEHPKIKSLLYRGGLIGELELLGFSPVDLIFLNRSPPGITFEIIKTGELIYCNSEEIRINFEANAFSMHQDFREFSIRFNEMYLETD